MSDPSADECAAAVRRGRELRSIPDWRRGTQGSAGEVIVTGHNTCPGTRASSAVRCASIRSKAMSPDWPDREERERARRVAWMIADFGWENALPEEADILPLLRLDDDVRDGDIHIFEGDAGYYLSRRTAERRVVYPQVIVVCPETGEVVLDVVGQKTLLSAELDSPARPYVASRRSSLS